MIVGMLLVLLVMRLAAVDRHFQRCSRKHQLISIGFDRQSTCLYQRELSPFSFCLSFHWVNKRNTTIVKDLFQFSTSFFYALFDFYLPIDRNDKRKSAYRWMMIKSSDIYSYSLFFLLLNKKKNEFSWK